MTTYFAKLWFISAKRFVTMDDMGIVLRDSALEWKTTETHLSKSVAMTAGFVGADIVRRQWREAGLSCPQMELVIFFSVDGSKFSESERREV